MHDLGEQYLFSVHMTQHLVYSIIAAPLLLLGTPTWMARIAPLAARVVAHRALSRTLHPGHDPLQRR